MSSAQSIPISNPTTSSSGGGGGGGGGGSSYSLPSLPIANPAFRSFVTRLSDSLRRAFSRRKPWYELIDRTAFSKPTSIADATTRIRKNYTYFRVNYLTLLAAVLAFSLLSHPFSLLTLISLLAAWLFLYLFRAADQPVVFFGRTFSDRETLGVLIVLTVIVIFLTSVGSLLMSATLIGLGIVCVHGAFRDPEDLFLDEQELPGSGLFSGLSGSVSSAAVAEMVSRV